MLSEQIPNGWAVATVGDIADKCGQRKPMDKETFTYVDIGSIDRERKIILEPQRLLGKDAPSRARKEINTGDVIVSLTRPNLNAVALVGEEYDGQIASTGFEVLKPTLIDSKYLFAIVRSRNFVDSISGKVQGALYPAAKAADVREFLVPVPPLAEQKQIAAKLDELLAQVDTLKTRLDAIPAILNRFRQSVLVAAVSGRLTEEWREQNETQDITSLVDEVNSKKTGKLKVRTKRGWDEELNLFSLPENWDWVLNHKLAEDASTAICAGPFGTIFKAKDFRDEGVPIIFLRHVKESGFNQNKPKYMDQDVWTEYHQEYSVHGGELLVTKLGDPPGESCIYPSDIGTAMVTPDVLKMNVDPSVADTKYLMYFFNSPLTKDMIKELAFGATRLRIDIAMFKSFPIPLPPREEQSEIVRCIEQLFIFADQIEQRLKDAQSRVNNLTQSILAKAFSGELTDEWREQNPDLVIGKNSAAALLEKIKADRAEAAKQKKPAHRRVKKKSDNTMKPKQIIPVVDALKAAKKPLTSQQLLAEAGYPTDASVEQLESFFLDIREQLGVGLIARERHGDEELLTLVD
ncbi:MAG: restriction endonuclease subunit S [Candidatus Sedimenticola sp. (ex Thyasira tokunagai)]